MLPIVFLYCSGLSAIVSALPFSKETAPEVQAALGGPGVFAHNNSSVSQYFDKDENYIRVPDIKFDDNRKKSKKSPKSTIQKIIKRKRKQKKRLMAATSEPTKTTEKMYEDPNFQEEDEPTTQTNSRPNRQRKKHDRKWRNALATIYPRKSRRKQRNINIRTYERKNNDKNQNKKRKPRDVGRELFILKDLDDIEVYGKDSKNVIVNSHVKKYW